MQSPPEMVPVVWGSDWATPLSGGCQAKAFEHEHDLIQTNHEGVEN